MKIINESFSVKSSVRNQMIEISSKVQDILARSDVENGEVTVFCPHTTGAITINENADPDVVHDMLITLDDLIPKARADYRHSEGNSDSHCKSSLIGCSEHILIEKGALVLGTWQGIYFCEFDGPRSRRVEVQIRGI